MPAMFYRGGVSTFTGVVIFLVLFAHSGDFRYLTCSLY